ncbi:glycoside hydrolase family 43 protein [Agrilactobacillus fermenti]|uniref:glycoside hydrolase family 43 protein n=1 Tax=Agrilactobacillus fermenti TaxID=2586909 RepID=UPI003A5C0FA8
MKNKHQPYRLYLMLAGLLVILIGLSIYAFNPYHQQRISKPRDHYLFVYFTMPKYPNNEQIHFAVSTDGYHFNPLHHNQPVFFAKKGYPAVRDPFIMRAQNHKGFYILATAGGWQQESGDPTTIAQPNPNIHVWHSQNLTDWHESLVPIADQQTKFVWAPEAIYDRQHHKYLVYWSQPINAKLPQSKFAIYAAQTKDFKHFTKPRVYLNQKNQSQIDMTIFSSGTNYYQFTKNETTKQVFETRLTQLINKKRQAIPSHRLVQEKNVEGPTVYKLYHQHKWLLLLDHYDQKGYQAFSTSNLNSGQFTPIHSKSYHLPIGARHGTVIPITKIEYQRLWKHYQ